MTDGHTTYSWQILNKVYTKMSSLYRTPLILPQVGRSDYCGVLYQPAPDYTQLDTVLESHRVRVSGKNEKDVFAGALMAIWWEPLYALSSYAKTV